MPEAEPAPSEPDRSREEPGPRRTQSLLPGDALGPSSPRSSIAPPPTSRWVGKERPIDNRSNEVGSGVGLAMSPRMTALFGGLFGLATVTTIIALLIQGVPPRDDRTEANAALSASEKASAAASESAPTASQSRKRVRTKVPGPWRVGDLAQTAGIRIVEDTIARRSFITALNEKGVPKDQVYRVMKAFDSVKKFDKLGKNDKFIVAVDKKDSSVKGFEYVISPLEVLQAREVDGLLVASVLDMKIAEEEVTGSFYIGKNLTKSIEWGGFEPDLLRVIDDAFAGKMSSESLLEGGTVRVVATEMTALGEFVKYKSIVAIEYHPPDPAAAPVRAYTYTGTGARGYFDDKGRQPDGSGWASPVPGAPVTSKFNPKRMHPVLKRIQPHNGTDYGAPTGTPIYAVFRGKLTFVGNAGPCGNMVAIKHANGIESGYCHMSKIAPGLKIGATIGTRQVIGQVGTTGRSTGPHLHFWTKREGKYFDSETLKVDGFRVIPGDERAAFGARKSELDGRLDAITMPDPPPADAMASKEPAPNAAKDASDDTKPAVGDGGNDSDESPAMPSGSTKPNAAPAVHDDPGDGDDLVGPDLGKK